MDFSKCSKHLIQLTSIIMIITQLFIASAKAAGQNSPFLPEDEARSFLSRSSGTRQNRMLTSALGLHSDISNGWEEIKEMYDHARMSKSQIERLEATVIHSNLPTDEKYVILNKLALGSLVGLGNVADKLLVFRNKGMSSINLNNIGL